MKKLSSGFNPEKEVPSLKMSKKLKKLGYPQEGGGWYWAKWGEKEKYVLIFMFRKGESVFKQDGYFCTAPNYYIKAPTVRELGEWLPEEIGYKFKYGDLIITKDVKSRWLMFYLNRSDDFIISKKDWESMNEVDARAKMVIWLRENGYIDFWGER